MSWTARHRFARISARKARLLTDVIRGRFCDEAVELLRFSPKRAAFLLGRVLKSAMASANEAEAAMSRLVVQEARVDDGPIVKRFRPKDRGRAHPIQKRTSHIIVSVAERGAAR
ncbi:MAG TPA: 50S ribosomal protein L22 [Phycisphaerae bacterium]|jgi:large subunit ribosomal protein L22|nr:50S ribosomal protein L22 [Phycisphaerae bacterium]